MIPRSGNFIVDMYEDWLDEQEKPINQDIYEEDC